MSSTESSEELSTLTSESTFELPSITESEEIETVESDVEIPEKPQSENEDPASSDEDLASFLNKTLSKELTDKYLGKSEPQDPNKNLYDDYEDVTELTLEDFRKAKPSNKLIIVHPKFKDNFGMIMAYMPWCPHCRNPETIKLWTDLAKIMKGKFVFGAVNGENRKGDNHILCQALKVNGYPSIYLIRKDKRIHPYKGSRSVKDLLKFVCDEVKQFCET